MFFEDKYIKHYTKQDLLSNSHSNKNKRLVESFFDCFQRREILKNGKYGAEFKPIDCWSFKGGQFAMIGGTLESLEVI